MQVSFTFFSTTTTIFHPLLYPLFPWPDKHEARRETRGGKCENVGCVATTLSLRLPNLEEHSRSLDTSLPALASSLCSHTLQSLTKTNIDRIIYPIHTIDLFISGNIDKTNVGGARSGGNIDLVWNMEAPEILQKHQYLKTTH
ncbi:hypothetical protein BLNAU_19410 [Blattamonas nauphoetae]|uniref:Uncharacterized protein n=1 Tax=Blattamonas nauphoetae TaxID=2049346 RepID=A0ABQ9X1L4_9EUKA|nr:hypothetical protein BLNAU_19410 [Blattamonas nauphoetae]